MSCLAFNASAEFIADGISLVLSFGRQDVNHHSPETTVEQAVLVLWSLISYQTAVFYIHYELCH